MAALALLVRGLPSHPLEDCVFAAAARLRRGWDDTCLALSMRTMALLERHPVCELDNTTKCAAFEAHDAETTDPEHQPEWPYEVTRLV